VKYSIIILFLHQLPSTRRLLRQADDTQWFKKELDKVIGSQDPFPQQLTTMKGVGNASFSLGPWPEWWNLSCDFGNKWHQGVNAGLQEQSQAPGMVKDTVLHASHGLNPMFTAKLLHLPLSMALSH